MNEKERGIAMRRGKEKEKCIIRNKKGVVDRAPKRTFGRGQPIWLTRFLSVIYDTQIFLSCHP